MGKNCRKYVIYQPVGLGWLGAGQLSSPYSMSSVPSPRRILAGSPTWQYPQSTSNFSFPGLPGMKCHQSFEWSISSLLILSLHGITNILLHHQTRTFIPFYCCLRFRVHGGKYSKRRFFPVSSALRLKLGILESIFFIGIRETVRWINEKEADEPSHTHKHTCTQRGPHYTNSTCHCLSFITTF